MAQALTPWRGGRVVYGSGLENQRAFAGTVGSNPTLSVTSPTLMGKLLASFVALYQQLMATVTLRLGKVKFFPTMRLESQTRLLTWPTDKGSSPSSFQARIRRS